RRFLAFQLEILADCRRRSRAQPRAKSRVGRAKGPRRNNLDNFALRLLWDSVIAVVCMMQRWLNGFVGSISQWRRSWMNARGATGRLPKLWSWVGAASRVWPLPRACRA